MSFLYEQIDTLREYGSIQETPLYVHNNLNNSLELRPYQLKAFENFVTYFENDRMCRKPTQVLFHMATGSGKTLVMAGLMIYLYKKGYRNFLFFVNLSNIVKKTKDNFLNSTSSKYLFAKDINIDGQKIKVNEVSNFQKIDKDAINICFTTTQGLHMDMQTSRENAISMDDFEDKKIVLIADEAHHLNVDLRRANTEEQENYKSWENTVRKIYEKNRDNVLLEFTATCDLKNENICKEYENKIVFEYPLYKFREEGYSKEIKTLRSDLDVEERALQALILSQYRYKVFQSYRILIKPVVFFKSRLVRENEENMEKIIKMIQSLTGDKIQNIFSQSTSEIILKAQKYFSSIGITNDDLASEIRDDFSEEHCISANDNQEVEKKQMILNSLEEKNNPYRAVFAVDKLNEGWDVLNLYDIVRLYETRDGKNGIPGKTTIKEAQLIGRGARYCPFKVESEQDKYRRKYDRDIDNPLRVCEELYYHCWNEPRYISELHTALRGIGLDLEGVVECNYVLKDKFKEDSLYRDGYVFVNDRYVKNRNDVTGLLPTVREKVYSIRMSTGQFGEDVLFEDVSVPVTNATGLFTKMINIGEIADLNYSIVYKALCKFPIFKFDILKNYFPNLNSTREFITNTNYLGDIKMQITSKYEEPSFEMYYKACIKVLNKVAESISKIEETYGGTTEFRAEHICDVFKNKKCNYHTVHEGGIGYSQNHPSVDFNVRVDLAKEDWFAFEDNYGTSEEKALVAYFKALIPRLKAKYDKVYLVRNERQLHIYSFEDGLRFEPDYLLFLHTKTGSGYEQLQIFIETKGAHLIEKDKWKEDFLIEIEGKAVQPITLMDDNRYKIWGYHFFNNELRMNEFQSDVDKLL